MPNEFVEVCSLDEIIDPGSKLAEVDDRLVVIFHVNGEVSCLDDICTHDGGPLSDGDIEGGAITCPRHGAKFDIKCGKALTMPATEDTKAHEAKVENGKIFVRLGEA
jgi:3-phenylpropionate/trans-cinnamate dioxygenase ferredoxin subunit